MVLDATMKICFFLVHNMGLDIYFNVYIIIYPGVLVAFKDVGREIR